MGATGSSLAGAGVALMVVALLLIALGLSWFMLAGWKAGSLTALERGYLALTPVPVILTVGVPLAMTMLREGGDVARQWSNRVSVVGICLGGVLLLAGGTLVGRRRVREENPAGRLWAGIFLAGIPVFLTLAVVVLYSFLS